MRTRSPSCERRGASSRLLPPRPILSPERLDEELHTCFAGTSLVKDDFAQGGEGGAP